MITPNLAVFCLDCSDCEAFSLLLSADLDCFEIDPDPLNPKY
jgi:hypothetical protein